MINITELLKKKKLAMHALLSGRQHSPIKFHALTDVKVAPQKSQMGFHMHMGITKNWKILQEVGIPDHLTSLLRNLYAGQKATVRTGRGTIA